jgi:hypothetical protein
MVTSGTIEALELTGKSFLDALVWGCLVDAPEQP